MIEHTSKQVGVPGTLKKESFDPALLREEIDEELQFHIDLLAQDMVRAGMSPESAQREALQRFGDLEVFREQCFRIQTRNLNMLQKAHLLLTVVLLIAVAWLGILVGKPHNSSPVRQAQVLVCDGSESDENRLQTLRWLRSYGQPGARNSEVVLAMLALAEETDEPSLRADIFRQLDEVQDPALKEALLEALSNDGNSEVRHEAAESLGPFSEDKDVRAALRKAIEEDTNIDVQRHAAISLLRHAEPAAVKEMATSPTSSAVAKLFALHRLRGMDRSDGDPRDHEVVQAMIELAASTKSSRVRADIFRNLDEVTDSILQGPLLEALANDRSAEVGRRKLVGPSGGGTFSE